jgi:hypothetical protein
MRYSVSGRYTFLDAHGDVPIGSKLGTVRIEADSNDIRHNVGSPSLVERPSSEQAAKQPNT